MRKQNNALAKKLVVIGAEQFTTQELAEEVIRDGFEHLKNPSNRGALEKFGWACHIMSVKVAMVTKTEDAKKSVKKK